MSREVVVVSAVRTAIGTYGGSLKDVPPTELAALVVRGALRGRALLPCVVPVRRVAPSSGLDPHDSLPASLKSIVDGIADALGLASDRDERVRWTYAQRRGVPGEHAVEVEVWPMGIFGNRPSPR